MKVSSLFCFLLVFIYFMQTSAWATGHTNPYTMKLLEIVAKRYNGYSLEMKKSEMRKFMASRPEADQEFVKRELGNFSSLTFPELKVSYGKFAVGVMGKSISFIPKSKTMVEVNGVDLDLSPAKLQESATKLEQILFQKTSLLWDFIMPEAYASYGIGIAALVVISLALTYVAAEIQNKEDEENKINSLCELVRNRSSELKPNASEEEVDEFNKYVDGIASRVPELEACNEKQDKERKELCHKVELCIRFHAIDNGTEVPSSVTQTERSSGKEVKESQSAPAVSKPKANEQ